MQAQAVRSALFMDRTYPMGTLVETRTRATFGRQMGMADSVTDFGPSLSTDSIAAVTTRDKHGESISSGRFGQSSARRGGTCTGARSNGGSRALVVGRSLPRSGPPLCIGRPGRTGLAQGQLERGPGVAREGRSGQAD